MHDDDPLVSQLTRAVLDGADVDWESAESVAASVTRPLVRELRLLATVAAVHRSTVGSDESARSGAEATVARPVMSAMPQQWGHLRIIERLGHGATGVVYRARDARLDRDVALKVVPVSAARDGGSRSTFIEEGRLLARVRHANVVTIHGADLIGNEVGLWMELVRGRTLEELLRTHAPFSADDAVEIGGQLCRAVAAVHDAGLLHRDIKATNVIRADDGRVVLMDFGTGRDTADAASSDLTGTPLYLAPEVLRGEPATIQSDVYSLGVLLYRLLTGGYPVHGTTLQAVRLAHHNGERASLRRARPDLAAVLVRVVERAIDPDPASRYATAGEMHVDLQQMGRRHLPSRRSAAVVVGLLIATAGLAWVATGGSTDSSASARAPRIAVLPFEALGFSTDGDELALGLTHEIQRTLEPLEGLTLISFTSSSNFPAKGRSLKDAGSRLRADLVLEGSLMRLGGTLRVHARLAQVQDEVEIWSDTFDRPDSDVFSILDDISAAIVNKLRVKLRIQRRYVTSPDAYFLLWKARALRDRRSEADALAAAALFDQVVALDPLYAPAWAGLSRTLAHAHRLGGSLTQRPDPRVEEGALKAIQIDELLADAQAALGNVLADRRDWARAEAAFRRAIDQNPSLTSAHTDFALAVLMPLNRNEEALRLLEEAISRDPASLDVRRVLAHFQVNAERFDDAIATSRWILDSDATFPFASLWLGRAFALSGRMAEAVEIFADNPRYWPYLGYTYAKMGRRADAEALAAAHPDDPRGQMLIYGGLDDIERAFGALNRLVATNHWLAATWLHRPEMKVLRADPRFTEVKARLGLE